MERYSSPILFHGPGAREVATMKVSHLGRLIHEPFGTEGLKIAESRELLGLMNSSPVGDTPGVIIVGPMDRANRSAQDVLLKGIEEFNERAVRPVLWAFDEADVLPTIRSRCLRQWCPAPVSYDEDIRERARMAVECALSGEVSGVLGALKDQEPRGLLEAAAYELSLRGIDRETEGLWENLRAVLRYKDPTPTEVLTAFL